MSTVTTHVLDTAAGRPAAGVPVRLETVAGEPIATGRTDGDGRCRELGPDRLEPGVYRLVFDTGTHLGPDAFFPEVVVAFRITDGTAPHHIPLLLSPFAFSSYRGS